MANHALDLDFNTALRKMEITDLVHADFINPVFKQLVNNDKALDVSLTDFSRVLKAGDIILKSGLWLDIRAFGAHSITEPGYETFDSSTAIQAAIAALPKKGGKLLMPPGTYLHGDGVTTGYSYAPVVTDGNPNTPSTAAGVNIGRDIRFILEDYENLSIFAYGAEIRSHDDNGECRNNSMFTFTNCNKLRVKGLKMDARSQYRIPVLSDYNSGQGYADRSNLVINFGKNIRLEDIESNYSMMDGIILSGDATAQPTDVKVINCDCYYNYRQGMTISSVNNCVVDGGNYSFTGVLRGTMPKAGIDMEADAYKNYNIVIKNATFDSNAVSGAVFSHRSSNCLIEKCKFINKGISSVNDLTCDNNVVRGNTFINCGTSLIQYGMKVYDNLFLINAKQGGGYLIDTEASYDDVAGKLTIFEGNTIICDLSNITLADRGYVGCVKLVTAKRKIRFTNNILRNCYCKTDPASYAIWISGAVETKGNQFIFDYVGDNVDAAGTLVSIIPDDMENNTVVGYVNPQANNFRTTIGACSDFRISKSYGLLNQQSKIFKLNARHVGMVRISTMDGNYNDYEVRYNGNVGALACNMVKQGGPAAAICNVYKDNASLWIEPLERLLVVAVDFTAISPQSRMDPVGQTLALDTVTDKATLTLVYKPLLTASVASREVITQSGPYIGFSTFDISRGKPIWWTGTVWKDATGLTI